MSELKNADARETDVKITRDAERWEVEVAAEIPADVLLSYRASALKEIRKTAKLDGFRPGHAPESVIIRIYGEQTILRHAAEHAIQHELPEILASQKLPIVETPRVTTETPVAGKPLSFKARAALAPEIKLPDYKKIAKKYPPPDGSAVQVTDEEHSHAMTHLRRERARIEKVETGTAPAEAAEGSRKMDEKDLPALDDDFAKSIGYESVTQFHDTVRENMKSEKERQAADARRQSILEDLAKSTTIKYPKILLDYELDDLEARLKDDLERAGTNLDSYLSETKKTLEQIRSEWKDAADKRARIRLVLAEIAREENISPDEKALAQEIEAAKKYYKGADEAALRSHIAHAMRNEATIRFLEKVE